MAFLSASTATVEARPGASLTVSDAGTRANVPDGCQTTSGLALAGLGEAGPVLAQCKRAGSVFFSRSSATHVWRL